MGKFLEKDYRANNVRPYDLCGKRRIITSTIYTKDIQKSNIAGTGKGKQGRLQAPGGQRGKRAIPPDGLNKFSLG